MTTWFCDSGHEQMEFKRKEDLNSHLLSRHTDFTQFLVEAMLARNQGEGIPRDSFCCPICESVPKIISQGLTDAEKKSHLLDHIGAHLLSLSIFSLPSEDRIPNDDEAESQQFSSKGSSIGESSSKSRSENILPYGTTMQALPIPVEDTPSQLEEIPLVNEEDVDWGVYDRIRRIEGEDDGVLVHLEKTQKPISLQELFTSDEKDNETDSESNDEDTEQLLGHELMSSRISFADDENYFVPIDKINQLVTLVAIQQELKRANIKGSQNRCMIADRILRGSQSGPKESSQKIFAILCMISLPGSILDFIEEEVTDSQLPFMFPDHLSDLLQPYCQRTGTPIMLFQDEMKWTPETRHLFDMYQWHMIAPYFHLRCEDDRITQHLLVDDRVVLPFTEMKSLGKEGSATVHQIKIHEAHYNAKKFSVRLADITTKLQSYKLIAKTRTRNKNCHSLR